MNQETYSVQDELRGIKIHRENLRERLQSTDLTSEMAYKILTDGSNNAVEYMDIIRALNISHLTNNLQLSSSVIQKLASYNPGDIPLDLFCEALTYTDKSKTLYLYASFHFIATIPDEDADSLTKIVRKIQAELHTAYPKTEHGQRFQRIVDSIKDLLAFKHFQV